MPIHSPESASRDDAPAGPRISADLEKLAEEHLARLHGLERKSPAERPLTRAPRMRRLGRALWTAGVWVEELLARPWKWLWNPRRPPGRWWARLLLLKPLKTFNWWKGLLFAFAILMGIATYAKGGKPDLLIERPSFEGSFWTSAPWVDTTRGLFAGALIALLAALWNDMFRCPWLGHRIRRKIRRYPPCVLHDNLNERPVTLVPREDPIEIAPRTDLFDDLMPGVLARDRKDVQILVGGAGAGKTTALVWLAGLLASTGIVPVLVPLRAREKFVLVDAAEEQFKRQVERFVRSKAEADALWRWLYQRRRVAILTDDIDQIGADGERGFLVRKALDEATTHDLPIVVTARPAGVPAGIAVSAIDIGPLDRKRAAECVAKGAKDDPGFNPSRPTPRRRIDDWIRAGQLADIPFYLELLAALIAAGRCPKLPEMDQLASARDRTGRYRRMPDGDYEWNPLWVRFLLLERFHAEVVAGRVRRWVGIEANERHSSMLALQGAALGTLVAAGMRASAGQHEHEGKAPVEAEKLRREEIIDFLDFDDRDARRRNGSAAACSRVAGARRARVSAHEAADTGERLRILERNADGKLQFRHRLMQAYLAGSRLAVIVAERRARGEQGDRTDDERDWIGDLLDPHHPEKITANMTLTFAAMSACMEREAAEDDAHGGPLHAGDGAGRAGRESDPRARDNAAEQWREVGEEIVQRLLAAARQRLRRDGDGEDAAMRVAVALRRDGAGQAVVDVALLASKSAPERGAHDGHPSRNIDPSEAPDPEKRTDPDDALLELTSAAEAANAIGYKLDEDRSRSPRHAEHNLATAIVETVRQADQATRWTKRGAIEAVARLGSVSSSERDWAMRPSWLCVWEFARDEDYSVRGAAADTIAADAYNAFHALRPDIEQLILRAAALSALAQPLVVADPRGGSEEQARREDGHADASEQFARSQVPWDRHDYLALRALGAVLPAIVSGLREDPDVHVLEAWQGREEQGSRSEERPSHGIVHRHRMTDVDYAHFGEFERAARVALEQLVALCFQGGLHPLEEALAGGFKADAMRHAHEREAEAGPNAFAGPGWVAGNHRLALDTCLPRAGSWHARLLLSHAVALYAIAGAQRQESYDALARQAHRGRERHPLAQRGTRLARAAIRRGRLPMARWHALIWDDENELQGRRQVVLNRRAAQLAADVALLLDLNEGSPEDCQEPFGSMRELPHCLSTSRDRGEILGKGCPPQCGWNFCPFKQPPPDEPNGQRGVSRAFCRQQRRLARHHRPRWQRRIRKRRLREFWREMERRART
ncbi:MAG: hypothetical protein ACRDK4_04145 [Solirubrobacteraceae bacterium]